MRQSQLLQLQSSLNSLQSETVNVLDKHHIGEVLDIVDELLTNITEGETTV